MLYREIINFIRDFVGFLLFAGCVYLLCVCIWGELRPAADDQNLKYRIGSYGHAYTRMQEAEQLEGVDVLFLGSSLSYRGFDPRIFSSAGYSSFNLGTSQQSPTQTKLLLENYLERLNPEVVIWAIEPGALASDGVESTIDIITNKKNDLYSVQMALATKHPMVYNTLIFSLYQQWTGRFARYEESRTRKKDSYIDGGFVQKELRFNENLRSSSRRAIKINPSQMRAFEQCASMIDASGIRLVLIFTPFSSSSYHAFPNPQAFDSLIAGYGEYHNFNNILELDDHEHFYDRSHLNQNGVEIFNQALIEMVFGN